MKHCVCVCVRARLPVSKPHAHTHTQAIPGGDSLFRRRGGEGGFDGGGGMGGRWGTEGLNAERLAFNRLPPIIAPRPPWEVCLRSFPFEGRRAYGVGCRVQGVGFRV